MWRCDNCGTMVPRGTVCEACGRQIDNAAGDIARKMGLIRHRRGVADRWAWAGAKIGFLVGAGLSITLAAIIIVYGLVEHGEFSRTVEILRILFPIGVAIALFFAFLFAAIFLVFGAVVKPIYTAIFGSVEHFEREYGTSDGD